jgi:tRNA threonylcarbamoyladenosine biosynthesis protein TsaB
VNLLALDTAADACSCALLSGGAIHSRCLTGSIRHADSILALAQDLLAEAGLSPSQLDGVTFGRGPGSFTGLRIACGVAQGIAFAADIPVAPVSTLAALAQGCYREQQSRWVLAALDARMGEVYWGAYELNRHGVMQAALTECVAAPESVPLPGGLGWIGAGSGWDSYGEVLARRMGDRLGCYAPGRHPQAQDLIPQALALFEQGAVVAADQALPVYLRNNVARKPGAAG